MTAARATDRGVALQTPKGQLAQLDAAARRAAARRTGRRPASGRPPIWAVPTRSPPTSSCASQGGNYHAPNSSSGAGGAYQIPPLDLARLWRPGRPAGCPQGRAGPDRRRDLERLRSERLGLRLAACDRLQVASAASATWSRWSSIAAIPPFLILTREPVTSAIAEEKSGLVADEHHLAVAGRQLERVEVAAGEAVVLSTGVPSASQASSAVCRARTLGRPGRRRAPHRAPSAPSRRSADWRSPFSVSSRSASGLPSPIFRIPVPQQPDHFATYPNREVANLCLICATGSLRSGWHDRRVSGGADPPARPQRVLAARRCLQDRRAGRARRRARDAGARPHRPRGDERRGRALQGAAATHGVKPIIGLEAYLVDDRNLTPSQPRYERNHLTLLASNDAGFRNLVKLSSAGFLEGFSRGKANVDMELLSAHSEGVIALTGCLQSRFCRRLVEDRPADARAHIDDLVQAFGPDQVYFEVQQQRDRRAGQGERGIVRTRAGARPAAGGDRRRALPAPRGLRLTTRRCSACRPSRRSSSRSSRFDTNEFYLEELRRDGGVLLGHGPRRSPTTLEIAERCEVEIELGQLLLPRFPTPEGVEPGRCCASSPTEGLRSRYGDPIPPTRSERLDFELGVIDEMGFESYFLIVWDFVTLREGERDRGRARPRLGRRLDRRLRAATSPTSTRSPTACSSSAS